MRLRIIDISLFRFWLVMFYQRTYGEPILSLSVYPKQWRNWFHFWQWEKIPVKTGYEATPEGGQRG